MSAAVAALGHADRNSNPGRMLAHASARSRALLTFSSFCSCCPVSTFLGITAHTRDTAAFIPLNIRWTATSLQPPTCGKLISWLADNQDIARGVAGVSRCKPTCLSCLGCGAVLPQRRDSGTHAE